MRSTSVRLCRALLACLPAVTGVILVGLASIGFTGIAAPPASGDVLGFSGGCQDCQAAAADSQGDIYAVDAQSHQVLKFDPSGNLIGEWGSYGSAPGFYSPEDVAVDGSNDVYVADEQNGVEEFTASGQYLQSFGVGAGAAAVALDPAGDVYVAQYGESVDEYSNAGTELNSWSLGTNGAPSGDISGLAYSSVNSDVYAVDEPADEVLQFTSSGTYLGSWGSSGQGAGQFEEPVGVAVDASGDVYVSDPFGNHAPFAIQRFSPDGTYVGAFSTGFTQVDGISYANNSLYGGTFRGVTRVNMTIPTASISASSTSPSTSQTVTFNASSSSLPFGSITD